MAEVWDAYDRQFNKIERTELIRGEAIPEGMYHLVCEIIVKHTDGTYLLMQRDLKKHYGGMWELTAGGSALAGETPKECAIRELREETGIVAFDLKECRRIVRDERHSLYVEFLCITNWDKSAIILQEDETIAYQWMERDALLEMNEDLLASVRTLKLMQEMNL